MTIADPTYVAPADHVVEPAPVQWGPIIAGSLAAAALELVLHSFAAAIGLAVSSTAPTWRDASVALWLLSGIYLIAVALATYGLGGYLAGRLRTRVTNVSVDEVEARDGAYGLLVWALATLMTGLMIAIAATAATRLAAPASAGAGISSSVVGENVIALELDRLLRDRRGPDVDIDYTRSEAARILLTSSSHTGVATEDRNYLVRLVVARTGLSGPDAERRVDTALANAAQNIARARRSTVILAFMAGVAALLGAAVAWFAACAGGRHRDGEAPSLNWTIRGPTIRVNRP